MMTQTSQINFENGSIIVSGEIHFANAMKIWEESIPYLEKNSKLNFDFSHVTQANSAAIALLLEWMKYAKQHNIPLQFNQLPEQLKSIAKVSGVEGLFYIKPYLKA